MGPQRAGTSWVDEYLRSRGDVCLPTGVKEIRFFDDKYSKGRDFYFSHFHAEEAHEFITEVTTTAFDHPDAPARVKEIFGTNIKMICPLRHPLQRTLSLYGHSHQYAMASGGLREVCETRPEIIGSSRYADHLERWLKHFPIENFHFVFQEDLAFNQNLYIADLCFALGLEYKPEPEGLKKPVNVATKPHSQTLAKVGQKMADFLRDKKLYWAVNTAKNLGLKKLFFGTKAQKNENKITHQDYLWLDEQLSGEVEKLEALIGPISAWQKPKEERHEITAPKMVRPAYSS